MKLLTVLSSLLLFGLVYCEPIYLLGSGYTPRYARRAYSYAAAPAAPPPVVNVNVQNVYNKQDNKQINNNNHVGDVNTNVVNNDVNVKQDINNNAISNTYNSQEINNKQLNNYGGYEPVAGYAAGYEAGREQVSRAGAQARRVMDYADRSRFEGNY